MKSFVVTAESELNVRVGPGSNFSTVEVLRHGEEVVSPDLDGWVPILRGGRVLFTSAKFLQEVTAAPAPATAEPVWLAWARKQIGKKEVPGSGDNPEIVDWDKLMKTLPASMRHDATPWCAIFVHAGFILSNSGITPIESAAAWDWMKFGKKVAKPQKGDVVIFTWDDGTHHVAYFLAIEGDRVRVIGGNQSNAVSDTTYLLHNVAGFRRPS